MSLGSLKSFLWYALHLTEASVLCFHTWVLSGLAVGSGCSLMAARWQVFFPTRVPSGFTSSPSMVAAIAGYCDILVYQYGRNTPFLKLESVKLLAEDIERNFLDAYFWQSYFGYNIKLQATKPKINKWDYTILKSSAQQGNNQQNCYQLQAQAIGPTMGQLTEGGGVKARNMTLSRKSADSCIKITILSWSGCCFLL